MSWKTLEESLKAVKQELKAEKRRSQHFNEVIIGLFVFLIRRAHTHHVPSRYETRIKEESGEALESNGHQAEKY